MKLGSDRRPPYRHPGTTGHFQQTLGHLRSMWLERLPQLSHRMTLDQRDQGGEVVGVDMCRHDQIDPVDPVATECPLQPARIGPPVDHHHHLGSQHEGTVPLPHVEEHHRWGVQPSPYRERRDGEGEGSGCPGDRTPARPECDHRQHDPHHSHRQPPHLGKGSSHPPDCDHDLRTRHGRPNEPVEPKKAAQPSDHGCHSDHWDRHEIRKRGEERHAIEHGEEDRRDRQLGTRRHGQRTEGCTLDRWHHQDSGGGRRRQLESQTPPEVRRGEQRSDHGNRQRRPRIEHEPDRATDQGSHGHRRRPDHRGLPPGEVPEDGQADPSHRRPQSW